MPLPLAQLHRQWVMFTFEFDNPLYIFESQQFSLISSCIYIYDREILCLCLVQGFSTFFVPLPFMSNPYDLTTRILIP